MTELEKQLDLIGPIGSRARLERIADLDLGKRSVAAFNVILKRNKRMTKKEIDIDISTIHSWINDPEAIELIRDKFSVQIDNYHRTKAFIQKGWDGKFHSITEKGCFQTGLLPLFLPELKKHFTVYAYDNRENEVEPIKLPLDYLRDYQREIVYKCIENKVGDIPFNRGIINAATNAGKTWISLALWQSFREVPTIFFLHRKTLFNQQVEFFQEHIGKDRVGQISDKIKDVDKDFVVAMYQSSRRADLKKFQMIITDEAHMAKGALYKRIISKCTKASIRFYISGTALKVNDIDKLRIMGSSGEVITTVSNKFLIDNNYSVKPIITIQKIRNSVNNYKKYREVIRDLIINNDHRNTYIQEFVNNFRRTRQTWVICRFKNHAALLADYCAADLLTGETPTKEANDILNRFKNREIDCVVSTMVIDTGMNLPIEAFVVALGGKSEIDVLQLIGRALRTGGEFHDVQVLDFYDEGRYVEGHSKERIRIYEQEKFDITYLK